MLYNSLVFQKFTWIPSCQSLTLPACLTSTITTVKIIISKLEIRLYSIMLGDLDNRRLRAFAGRLSGEVENPFVDGAVIAAARSLPTWSDGDIPPLPNEERKAARELQEECRKMLADFPTTSEEDRNILGMTFIPTSSKVFAMPKFPEGLAYVQCFAESNPQMRRTWEAAIL